MHPVFDEITPSWLDRAHVYTGSIGDYRYRFAQTNNGTTILASVYTKWCYEVAKDVHEKEYPWDDAGIAEMRNWLQQLYDAYTSTGALPTIEENKEVSE